MIPVKTFTLPTFYPVGPVNVYLIKSEPYTLIDAGPYNPQALEILHHELSIQGIELNQIKRIVLTHGHQDHTGLADTLEKMSGAEIWLHQNDLAKVQKGYWQLDQPFLAQLGIPDQDITEILAQTGKRNADFGSKLLNTRPLYGGETFSFTDFYLEVIPTPGHSPGSVCLYAPQDKILFSGDHILTGITPNPILEPDSNGSWISVSRQYLQSLRDILNKEITIVHPGHGLPFADIPSKASDVFANYSGKMNDLSGLLNNVWQTPYVLAHDLYPNAQGFELFLAVSKVIGLLDLMSESSQVLMAESEGKFKFKKA